MIDTHLPLLAALVLLWSPRAWYKALLKPLETSQKAQDKKARKNILRDPGDQSIRVQALIAKPLNWIDLVRATAGTWLLLNYKPPGELEGLPLIGAQIAITLVGVAIQCLRFSSRASFYAPVCYLSGVAALIAGYPQGVFGVLLAWVFVVLTPNPSFFLILMSACIYGMAALFDGVVSFTGAGAALLVFSPVFLSAAFGRRLTILSRRVTF